MIKRAFFLILFALMIILVVNSYADIDNNEYCTVPPFIQSKLPSNVMLVLDYSGSMGWPAYNHSYAYDKNKTYYGYFIHNKYYAYNSASDYYYIVDNPTNTNDICDPYNDDHEDWSGNCLNYYYMTRIDILRWILTGGKALGGCVDVDYCDKYTNKKDCRNNSLCKWNKNKKYCYNKRSCSSLDSSDCTSNELCGPGEGNVETENGKKIKKEDVSSFDANTNDVRGILQDLNDLDEKPRMGANFFNSSIKDRIGLSYNYAKLIDKINNTEVGGGTGTKGAMDEIKKLFSRDEETILDYENKDPYEFDGETIYCARNTEIVMSDGEWNNPNTSTSSDPVRPAYEMWMGNSVDLVPSLKGKQNVKTYTVAMFLDSVDGRRALKHVAVFGNFEDVDGNKMPCNYSSYPNTSLTTPLPDTCPEWDKNGDGVPDGYYEGSEPNELKKAIEKVFSDILKKASSGSAASVLATNEESGAVILQALFYPKRYFDRTTNVDWVGSLQNLWFYLGPFTQNIREDTDEDEDLDLLDDYVIDYFFDNETSKTMVHVYKDTNGDGIPDETLPDKSVADIKFLWEAGKVLWETRPDDRNIFTYVNESKVDFIIDNKSLLKNYLDADNDSYAENIIKYIRGEDLNDYRNRTVTIGGGAHVWKLGDIIYSTPQIISGSPLNSYHKNPPYGYGDATYKKYTESNEYKNRGMVFVGANDGMLHAFRLGKIVMLGNSRKIAKLKENPVTYELGSEAWAFIPKNALPYLKYYMDPSYCHLYYVDLTPYVFDASICAPGEHENDYFEQEKTGDSSTWRTIVIGGMRFGGACGDNSTDAVTPPNDSGNVPSGVGLSSYFAIDVTDPENPIVLWEFSDNNTAFTTTGPSIIHIPAKKLENGEEKDDHKKNGYWYVAFASGPDNYDGTVHQPLYLYVLDLKTGELKHKWQLSGDNCTSSDILTCQTDLIGKHNAFAGRMFESSIDIGTNYKETYYSDDGMYFGYTYKDSGGNWKGGVIRVITNDDPNVKNWKITKLIDDIGPVTSGVKVLEDRNNKNLWVYFGEGRYFSREDDISAQRRIYGIKDPCYDSTNERFYESCETTISLSDLMDVTDNGNADTSNSKGWYIRLDEKNGSYGAERVITDPVVSSYGWVLYTTFSPTNDICGFGGHSDLWLVNYDNGGTPNSPSGSLYIQTSTGAIVKIEMSEEFGKDESGAYLGRSHGRKTGKPINEHVNAPPGVLLLPEPLPVHIIHWREK